MLCPKCGTIEDTVIESRQNALGTSIRRRRECSTCGRRFTSYEYVEEAPLKVIKRDGRRESFDSAKLKKGIERSLEKRPVSQSVIKEIVLEIENELAAGGKDEISSGNIGELVLKKLYAIDMVAYVRFASVYKMFTDVEEFIKEIEMLSMNKKGGKA